MYFSYFFNYLPFRVICLAHRATAMRVEKIQNIYMNKSLIDGNVKSPSNLMQQGRFMMYDQLHVIQLNILI